jgi:hypothetical protein
MVWDGYDGRNHCPGLSSFIRLLEIERKHEQNAKNYV